MNKFINQAFLCDNREIFLKLPDNSIDLILTDPPYKDYQSNRPRAHKKVKKIQESQFDLSFFIAQSIRVLKPGCHFYCWCDHLTFPGIFAEIQNQREQWHGLPLSEKRLQQDGYLKYKNCLIWVKNNHGSGDLKSNFAPQHEFILFASKGQKTKHFNGQRPSNVLFKRTEQGLEFYKKVNNYRFNHGTSKPVEILTKLIDISTVKNDLVFDPYAGSMSTGEACQKCGRDYLLVEIDQEFYEQGLERLHR